MTIHLEPGSINCTCCPDIKTCRNIPAAESDDFFAITVSELQSQRDELLAALKNILENAHFDQGEYDAGDGFIDCRGMSEETTDAIKIAEAAIKRAEGRA
jgi:hypothetical protein